MDVKAYDAVKIPEKEWDNTPPEQRGYVERFRKNGFVYGINEDQEEIYDCPIHGKLGGIDECPLC